MTQIKPPSISFGSEFAEEEADGADGPSRTFLLRLRSWRGGVVP
jgi:hypothetical protein